ncbi:MAG TPA: hypothetical protein VFV52_11215, partial [Bacilli bacterium]|nr:hypothetical protein [Bacilli bacterium]
VPSSIRQLQQLSTAARTLGMKAVVISLLMIPNFGRIIGAVNSMASAIKARILGTLGSVLGKGIARAAVIGAQGLEMLRDVGGTLAAPIQRGMNSVIASLQPIGKVISPVIGALRRMNSALNLSGRTAWIFDGLRLGASAVGTAVQKMSNTAGAAMQKLKASFSETALAPNKMVDSIKGVAGKLQNLAVDGMKNAGSLMFGQALQQQQALDNIQARAGNDAQGQEVYDRITHDAASYGQDVQQALNSAQVFMSKTTDPQQLEALYKLTLRYAAVNPSGGVSGATSAIKAMMTDVKSPEDMSKFTANLDQQLTQQNMSQGTFDKTQESPLAKWETVQVEFQQKFVQAGQVVMEALGPVFDRLSDFLTNGSTDGFFSALSNGVYMVIQAIGVMIDVLQAVFGFIVQNWSVIEPILLLIVGVYLTGMLIGILEVAAAWLLAMWPILLVVGAIALIIKVLNMCGISTDQILGFIGGAFGTLFAFIWNMIAFVWNLFASFAEFLINLFIDPVYAVRKLFYDLAMTFLGHIYNMLRSVEDFSGGFSSVMIEAINFVLKGINLLIDGLNKIPGFNLSHIELFDPKNVHAVSDKVKAMMDNLKEPTSDKNIVSIPRMEEKNLSTAYDSGASFVSGLTDGFNSSKQNDSGSSSALDAGASLGTGSGFTGGAGSGFGTDSGNGSLDKVGEVGQVNKIDDTVDVSSEDLKVMRELAEMQSIQNFVTLTPTVSVQTGDVHNSADVETIVRKIGETLQEQIATSAAGVYGHG